MELGPYLVLSRFSDNPEEQIENVDTDTISFNLAPNVALGQATEAVEAAIANLGLPPGIQTKFSGSAQAFQDSLTSIPLLILAALVAVYLILGVLYESYIHPLTIL